MGSISPSRNLWCCAEQLALISLPVTAALGSRASVKLNLHSYAQSPYHLAPFSAFVLLYIGMTVANSSCATAWVVMS